MILIWCFAQFARHFKMPPMPFDDGTPSTTPEMVAAAWCTQPVIQDRANRCQRLIQPYDPKESVVAPSRENMVKNSAVLVELARDMANRDRSTADPIDSIADMCFKFYEKYPLYPEINKDFDKKVWGFADAWAIHKMITRLRGVVPKHTKVRETRIS